MTQVRESMFSDHNRIKPEINNRKLFFFFSDIYKLIMFQYLYIVKHGIQIILPIHLKLLQ